MEAKKKIFLPQEKLEAWVSEGKISFTDNIITTFSDSKVSYTLVPAYKFLKLSSGDNDEQNLLGTIKTKEDLKDLNPDIFRDSIIINDNAYEVETGYIGNLNEEEKDKDYIALLSKYILDNI